MTVSTEYDPNNVPYIPTAAGAWLKTSTGKFEYVTEATPLPVTLISGGGAVTIADGADVAEGAIADVGVTGDTAGTVSAKLRGANTTLAAILAAIQALSIAAPTVMAANLVIGANKQITAGHRISCPTGLRIKISTGGVLVRG